MSDTFQGTIRAGLGVSAPGEVVETAGSYYQAKAMVTEDDQCYIGGYVRAGTSEPMCKSGGNTGEIVGVIVRDKYLSGCSLGQKLPNGTPVTVAVFGVIAVANASGAEAVFLDDVWVNDTTGAVTFDHTGTVAGATKTHWKVKQGAPAGGIAFVTR